MESGRVLIVEDDFLIRLALAVGLAEHGYTVVEADDAAQALSLLQTAVFDVMVTDLSLGGAMDGVALAQAARRSCPGLRVVYATGQSPGAAAGEDPVVFKPYQAEAVCAVIGGMLWGDGSDDEDREGRKPGPWTQSKAEKVISDP